MRIEIDLTGVQEADDGNTTHYGGVFRVGGVELQAGGTDRDDGYNVTLCGAIESILGRELRYEEEQFLMDEIVGRNERHIIEFHDDKPPEFVFEEIEGERIVLDVQANVSAFTDPDEDKIEDMDEERGFAFHTAAGVDTRRVLQILFDGFADRLRKAGISVADDVEHT